MAIDDLNELASSKLVSADFCRPAEVVGPELVGCRLVKRQDDGSLVLGVIVERRRIPKSSPPVTATAATHPKTKSR